MFNSKLQSTIKSIKASPVAYKILNNVAVMQYSINNNKVVDRH